MKKRASVLFLCMLFLLPMLLSCSKKEPGKAADKSIRVLTTLFPLYDFARNVGGNNVSVELLLPPGMEPHSFEPKPGDIRKINDADIFIFTGKYMEPWVEDVLKGITNDNLLVVDTSVGILPEEDSGRWEHRHDHGKGRGGDGHHHEPGAIDPHIWLDFSHAQTMVENILNGFIAKDPGRTAEYMKNAGAYASRLSALDKRFREALASCRKDVIIHGGHFAFGYLARRYHLKHLSAVSGFSPNAEPSPKDMIALIRTLKDNRVSYVFFEELVVPNVAETVSRETGAKLLMLHGAHNVSKKDWDQGVTFISLMEENLKNLKTGLECQ